ncbi:MULTISPECIES: hypothetical protein [unclassified Corallococcus]|uniref:hypothetical protein n=1 Tax=unclassified Corallococcus TaxID=2685029 RepID=UPI001A8CFD67|nr:MULTISPECIES: hypothetical protein [unclassified Corallococcus]MBN9687812.1 hypothetical protein [Corallococcus sp. NCSPR001]WAS88376.1 hypothetical protein O0N60_15630 [Corallococcus sp. NCRR]
MTMRIQSRVPPQEPRKGLAAGGQPATARNNAAQGTPPRTPEAAARRAGFSEQSAFVSKQPDVTSTLKREFGALASDKQQFHQTMRTVYGEGYDAAKAEQFRQQALKGDFGWLPPVRTVPAQTLNGANGAYDAESGTVLINESLDPSLAASTYVEEAGHHLDTKLNTEDTQGDEGELFRRILSGEKLSPKQVADIRAENDKGTIVVDGKSKEVEFWNPFKAVGDLVSGAAKAVGSAVSTAANWVGNTAKTVGSAVSSAANWVGNAAKSVWGGIKTVANRAGDGVRSLFTGAVSTVVGAFRNVGEGIGTFFGGIGKLFQGKFGEGFKQMGLGLLKTVVQTPVDAILMMGGRALSAIQTLIGVEPPARKLSDSEIATLRSVYGDSIDYSSMRIKEGNSGLFSTSGRAFTHGNTIYIPPDDLPLTPDLLVHESAHVWQHQNGGTDYMSEALVAQNLGDGYDFEKGLDAGKPWSDLNPEQQAEFLQQAQLAGYFANPAAGFHFNGKDYTAQIEAAIAQVRAGKGAP